MPYSTPWVRRRHSKFEMKAATAKLALEKGMQPRVHSEPDCAVKNAVEPTRTVLETESSVSDAEYFFSKFR